VDYRDELSFVRGRHSRTSYEQRSTVPTIAAALNLEVERRHPNPATRASGLSSS